MIRTASLSMRTLALLIAGLLVLSSLACGGDDNNNNGTNNTTGTNNSTNTGELGPNLDSVDFSGSVTLKDREEDPSKPDYYATKQLLVSGNLTIEPGVVIEFEPGSGLNLTGSGVLKAEGTSTKGIVLKERTTDPWLGVTLNSSGLHRMVYVTVNKAGRDSGGGANVSVTAGELDLKDSTLSASAKYGIIVDGGKLGSATANVTVTSSADAAVYTGITSAKTLGAFTFDQNTHVAVYSDEDSSNGHTTALTLPALSVPYRLTGDASLDISEGGSLTIDAGVQLGFDEALGLSAASTGKITTNGTADRPVRLYSWTEGKSWTGVYLTGAGQSSFTHTTIERGGGGTYTTQNYAAGLSVGADSNPATGVTMDHVTISSSAAVGLALAGFGSTFTATAVEIKDAAGEAVRVGDLEQLGTLGAEIKVTGGAKPYIQVDDYTTLSDDLTISTTGAPIHLTDDLSFESTLTIASGVELRFAEGTGMYVSGTLKIGGTAEKKVVLGAISDTAGGWGGIQIKTNNDNTIAHAEIKQGGGTAFDFIGDKGTIVLGDGLETYGKLTMSDTTISSSAGWGIFLFSILDADLTLTNVTYSGNTSGDVNE